MYVIGLDPYGSLRKKSDQLARTLGATKMAIEKELLVVSICQLDDVVPIYTLDDVESVFFYDSTGCKAEREATQLPALFASYTHSTQYIYKLCISHSGHTVSHLCSCNSHRAYSSILLDCAGVQSFIYLWFIICLFLFIMEAKITEYS